MLVQCKQVGASTKIAFLFSQLQGRHQTRTLQTSLKPSKYWDKGNETSSTKIKPSKKANVSNLVGRFLQKLTSIISIWSGGSQTVSGTLKLTTPIPQFLAHCEKDAIQHESISIHKVIFTPHQIQIHLTNAGVDPMYPQNYLSSSQYRFIKVLETFLRDFGPHCHGCITKFQHPGCESLFPPHPKSCSIGSEDGYSVVINHLPSPF